MAEWFGGVLELRQSFQAEGDDREKDDDDGKDSNDTGRERAFGVLEQQPHPPLEGVFGHGFDLLLHETFLFSVTFYGRFSQLVELNLLHEDVQRNVYRPA